MSALLLLLAACAPLDVCDDQPPAPRVCPSPPRPDTRLCPPRRPGPDRPLPDSNVPDPEPVSRSARCTTYVADPEPVPRSAR